MPALREGVQIHWWTVEGVSEDICNSKLHMLESHVWVQMQFFCNLGVFGEDPVERWHNKDNQANRLLNNIKTFFRAELVKANRRSTSINREWM